MGATFSVDCKFLVALALDSSAGRARGWARWSIPLAKYLCELLCALGHSSFAISPLFVRWRFAMTIFAYAITGFPEWVTVYLLRGKRHYDSAELENLSDRSLEDIGLEVIKRNFGTLKPFWIP
jgi:hypothetical protein